MAHGSNVFKFGAAFAAFGMVLGSAAHAAPSSLGGVDPLVSLSAFGTSSSRAAVCAGGTAAADTAGLQSGASCLPFVAAASAAAAAQDTQQQQDDMGTAYAPVAEPRSTLSALALPFGVFALGVLLILLFDDDDDDDDDTISPN
jgi:hypothetical protein